MHNTNRFLKRDAKKEIQIDEAASSITVGNNDANDSNGETNISDEAIESNEDIENDTKVAKEPVKKSGRITKNYRNHW